MPAISTRGQQAYDSPIRSLIPYANEAEKQGKNVFYLNIGQPDILTPKNAIEAIKNTDLDIVKYAPAIGNETYREKLVEYYQRFNIQMNKDNFLVTTGASEAIFLTMLSCLDEGDEVIIPEPFYAIYNGFSNLSKVKIVPLTCAIKTGFELPSTQDFEAVITPKTKAIFICNPNNPTGCLYSEKALKELALLVKKYNLFLFVDEVYREFCYDGQAFYSALRLEGLEDNVVVVDSVSKRFSACGARVGAIATHNKAILEAAVRFARYRLSPPTFGQILAEACLDTPLTYIEEVRQEYDLRRQTLYNRLSQMEGVVCYQPKGAFYNFVRLPIDNSDAFCKWLLTDFEHKGNTLMLSPGTGFYATEGLGKQEVRIAYVLNVKDLNSAMDALESALEKYPNRAEVEQKAVVEL